jgi:hypothetical protein
LSGRWFRRLLVPTAAIISLSGSSLALTAAPAAATQATAGYGCGYYSNVSLFGGPFGSMGCGTQTSVYANANSAAPSVNWVYGSAQLAQDPDGAKAQYGPADMLSSPWLPDDTTHNTGLLQATSNGTSNVNVTAKAVGVGPSPFYTSTPDSADNPSSPAGYVQSSCTASSATSHSGSVTVMKGWVDTKLDANGYPVNTVAVPTNISAGLTFNYRVNFTIDNISPDEHGHMIFNERITNPDGSYTVNGAHMYLEGPTAVGDVIIAQSTCGHA